jgi:hypothetical protein
MISASHCRGGGAITLKFKSHSDVSMAHIATLLGHTEQHFLRWAAPSNDQRLRR